MADIEINKSIKKYESISNISPDYKNKSENL
jgi:hypothetical protein